MLYYHQLSFICPCIVEGEMKCGAFTYPAVCPDSSIVPLDDALHDRQPHAGSLKFAYTVKALKGREQFIRKFRIESYAVVAYREHVCPIYIFLFEVNMRVHGIAGKLPCIAEQIGECNG